MSVSRTTASYQIELKLIADSAIVFYRNATYICAAEILPLLPRYVFSDLLNSRRQYVDAVS